ncbi:MAG: YtxH domain-containing protein [Pseudomonadota bacterium]
MNNLKDKAKNLVHKVEENLHLRDASAAKEIKDKTEKNIDQTKKHAEALKHKAKEKAIEGKEHAEAFRDKAKENASQTKDKAAEAYEAAKERWVE